MLRGGWVDVSIQGALAVSSRGDLANWAMPLVTEEEEMDYAAGEAVVEQQEQEQQGQQQIEKGEEERNKEVTDSRNSDRPHSLQCFGMGAAMDAVVNCRKVI